MAHLNLIFGDGRRHVCQLRHHHLMVHLQVLVFRFLVLLPSCERADLESVRNVLVAIALEGRRGSLFPVDVSGLLLRASGGNHLLLGCELVQLAVPSHHGRIIVLLSLIGHHLHDLVLRQPVVHVGHAAWLVRVVQNLRCLTQLFGSFALGRRRIILAIALALARAGQLDQVLVDDGVLRGATARMGHLL